MNNSMNTNRLTYFIVAVIVSTSGVYAAKDVKPVRLTEAGKKLEAEYAGQMASLKTEIMKALPSMAEKKKSAFMNARKREVAAEMEIQQAQKLMDSIKSAKGLVGHAKGKWIGGAKKGIAAATAKLKKATTEAEREAAKKELAKWQQNLTDGQDALKERQAKLDKVEKDRPRLEKILKDAKQNMARAKAVTAEAFKDIDLKPYVLGNLRDDKLAKYVVFLEATPRGLAEFAQQGEDQKELVETLLSSRDLLPMMVSADGAKDGKYGRAMQIWHDIRSVASGALRARDKSLGPLHHLAFAISLEHAVPVKQRNAVAAKDAPEFVDPVKRYLHYEKAFLAGELDPAFQYLSTWDMRMIVNGEEPDEILAWGREMMRSYRPDHVTTPDYRWRYVAAVRSDIRYGSQDNKHDKDELQFFQNILMNGGICGRRAFFGRFALRSFGIPTTARPQRGHAALAHWTPDGWVVCLGAGWGSGWTKTRYDRDLDFLATTQARMAGDSYLQVKRLQWIGDVMGEPRVFGLLSKAKPGFWYGVSLYKQKEIIATVKAKTLAAVGEDIGEANETKEKVDITKVTMTDADRKISIDAKGVISIPAAATSKPTKSTGKIIFMNSHLGGKQLHYSRTGGHQSFEYTFDAPATGKYRLSARVATPSWKQNLLLVVNDTKQRITIPLPHTVGLWGQSAPVVIELEKGKNLLSFSRAGEVKGVSIKDFTLTPVTK